jgi:NTE family protein
MKKLGICLTGGGARGAYQIGALAALKDLGILKNVQAFAGTSIGAANSALVASNPIENVKDIWFNVTKKELSIAKPLFDKIARDHFKYFEQGIHSMDEFEDVLVNKINLKELKEKEVYVTISEGGESNQGFSKLVKSTINHYVKHEIKAHYISLATLNDIHEVKSVVMASCAIPIIFSSIDIDGKKYYDGGVFDNIPVKPLVDAGCDEIIVIHLTRFKWFSHKKFPNVVFHEIIHKGSLGSVLEFSPQRSVKLYHYGYEDTMKYFLKDEKK